MWFTNAYIYVVIIWEGPEIKLTQKEISVYKLNRAVENVEEGDWDSLVIVRARKIFEMLFL